MSTPVPNWALIALVRARPRLDWYAYVDSIGMFLMYAMVFATYALGCATLCLEGAPLKFWRALVQCWPQLLLQVVGREPDAAHSRRIIFLFLCVVLVFVTVWGYVQAHKAFKAFRGLVAFSRAPSLPSVSAHDFLHVSLPLWLLPDVVDTPSPTTVLDVVQEYESAHKPLREAIAACIADAQEDPSPAIGIRISLAERLTVSLVGRDGKQETTTLHTDSWSALVAYLALQPRGAWVPRKKLLKEVYGGTSAAEYSLFRVHVGRINDFLTTVAMEVELLSQGVTDTDGPVRKITVFERAKDEQPVVRLLPACEVAVFPRLASLQESVMALKADAEHPGCLSREELNRRCSEVMQSYGKGFLAEHQPFNTIWPWAREWYITYRDMCLFVLEYAAERNSAYAADQRLTDDEQAESMSHAAQCYGWYALVASGIIPKVGDGEQALRQCLTIYRDLEDRSAAEDVYEAYAEQMLQKDGWWKPSPETTQVWLEVTAQSDLSRRSRKRRSTGRKE